VEFWTAFLPTAAVNGSLERSPWAVDLLVRMTPGSTPQRVEAALAGHYESLAASGASQYAGARATSRTVSTMVTGDVRPAFRALAVAGAIVLLVTCANVAGLLLLRASGRRRELAVRMALGAERVRLVRTLARQYGVVAIAGGVMGGVIATAAVRAFAALAPEGLPRIAELGVDWRLFAMLLAVTLVVVLVVALGPALAATRVDPASVLGATHAGVGGGRSEVRVRRLLVGAQVALALAVLAAATLLGRSLGNARSLALGVDAPERLSFVELIPSAGWDAGRVSASDPAARRAHWLALQDQILARTAALPGVTGVAPVVHEAYAGTAGWDARLEAEGAAAGDSARRPYLNMEITNEDYLRVTGTALVRGRWIAATDREGAVPVIVLSEGAARALFPGEDAVGRRVKLWAGRTATVVGIVADTRFRELLVARPSFYLPHRQFDGSAPFLAVRTSGEPAAIALSVRGVVTSLAPGLLVQDHGTLRARLAGPLARPRLLAAVMLGYAAVAVLLAVAGLYAVVAQGVATRRREFAVRSALGATPRALWSLVLRDGGRVAIAGVAVGVPLALVGGELLSGVLFEVAPTDPATLALSAGVVLVLALAAAAPSAWRAGRVRVTRAMDDV
jgi:predicted permease